MWTPNLSRQGRPLVPNPCVSWEQHQRFTHDDLRELSVADLWAEQTALKSALALQIARHRKPTIVQAYPVLITDSEWMRVRLHLLHAERLRRRHDPDLVKTPLQPKRGSRS